MLPINNMKNIKALAYDPVREFIYWIEGKGGTIKRAHDNGTMVWAQVSRLFYSGSMCRIPAKANARLTL